MALAALAERHRACKRSGMMRSLALGSVLLFAAAACGPRFEPAPRPLGGYPTLVLNDRVEFPLGRLTGILAAGTRLVADGTIGGEAVFCGPALVGPLTERVCFARRGADCLSVDAAAAPVCFRPGIFLEEWS